MYTVNGKLIETLIFNRYGNYAAHYWYVTNAKSNSSQESGLVFTIRPISLRIDKVRVRNRTYLMVEPSNISNSSAIQRTSGIQRTLLNTTGI